jgi:hypothetical protein
MASLGKLEARSAIDWGGDVFVRGRDGVKQVDESYAARDLDTAYARRRPRTVTWSPSRNRPATS